MIKNSISKIRKELNITQEELARDLNISRQTIIALENNKNNISLELAFDISNYFNKEINEVFYKGEHTMKTNTIEDIRNTYGKNTIIIKDNLVFRCATEVLEIGPNYLCDLELRPYGKMKKFVVLNDKVYELIPTRKYDGTRTDVVKHTLGNEVDIDYTIIDFNERTAWNYKK